MTSEYRALRARVIRLWTKAQGNLTERSRRLWLNEAIDQALAESISRDTRIDRSREMFVQPGHELRSPLGVVLKGRSSCRGGTSPRGRTTGSGRVRSQRGRDESMVADLLDLPGSGRAPLRGGDTTWRQDRERWMKWRRQDEAVFQFTPTAPQWKRDAPGSARS